AESRPGPARQPARIERGPRKRSIQYSPARVSQSSRPSRFEMSLSWRPFLRAAMGPPSRWNAGTPVCRVNIAKNIQKLRDSAQGSLEETAEVLHVSPDAVKRDWRSTKLW